MEVRGRPLGIRCPSAENLLMLGLRRHSPLAALAAAGGALVLGSASGVTQSLPSVESASPSPTKPAGHRPLRVLITGFHDWRELDGNVWRCRDNPSCRLIYGAACPSPPIERRGPLVTALRKGSLKATFDFVTMPTLWHTAAGLDLLAYDVVFHLGLGVYDGHDKLLIELGAYNERRGGDAQGSTAGHTIDAGSAQELPPPPELERRIMSLSGTSIQGFKIDVAPARAANTFICNETHHRALRAHALGDGAPSAVYFIHLPYPAKGDEGHTALGAGVAALISTLVQQQIEEAARGDE